MENMEERLEEQKELRIEDARKLMRLYDSQEYQAIWWGAAHLASAVIELIEGWEREKVRTLNNTKYVRELLKFLLKSKYNMLNYVIGGTTEVWAAPVKGAKKKEYRPYRMAAVGGVSLETAGVELIGEEDYKWRELARIFLDAARNAADTIAVMSGRGSNEVFNQLIHSREFDEPPPLETGADVPKVADIKPGHMGTHVSEIPVDFSMKSVQCSFFPEREGGERKPQRKFIMVQLPEPFSENTEAYKAGYKNICEIGKERIRRAAKKIAEEHPDVDFDGGFQDWKIGNEEVGNVENGWLVMKGAYVSVDQKNAPEDYIEAALWHARMPPETPMAEITILGGRFWITPEWRLVIADDRGTTTEQVEEILKHKPDNIALIEASPEITAMIGRYLDRHEQMEIHGRIERGDLDDQCNKQ